MAKYDRRLLIPYLQDVCCVELLLANVNKTCKETANQLRHLQLGTSMDKEPEKPWQPKGNWIVTLCVGGALAVAAVFLILSKTMWTLVGIGSAGLAAFLLYSSSRQLRRQNRYLRKMAQYRRDMDGYNNRRSAREENLEKTAQLRDQLEVLRSRRQALGMLLDQLYAVGIVPESYRNVYASWYLCEAVQNGGGEDPALILQSFVLKEAITELEKNGKIPAEVLIRRRVMTAIQHRLDHALAREYTDGLRHAAQLPENREHQALYLQIIEADMAVTRYFGENDYIVK